MNKIVWNIRTLIVLGLTGLSIAAAIGALLLYRRPLGPALETYIAATPATVDLPGRAPTSVAVALPAPTGTPAATAVLQTAPTATSAPPGVCGETAVWNVLLVGSDAADLYYPPGSDLTRVLRVDFPNKTVSIFAFSRDLWVDASELDLIDPGITFTKLGMVFYEARQRSTESDPRLAMLDGVNATAQTLAYNFDVSSDHYIALDLDKFPAMIDAIGGVPINIPKSLIDPKSGMAFKAGEQTLNGKQAAIYARAYVDNDLSRIQRDHLVVEALRVKLLDPWVWVKIPELFLQFNEAVVTDFSPEQVNHLVCLMKEVQPAAIIQDGVLAAWTSPGPQGSLLWDETSVQERLRTLEIIR